jgi:hypothetical protein
LGRIDPESYWASKSFVFHEPSPMTRTFMSWRNSSLA